MSNFDRARERERFAEMLVRDVRDLAIRQLDMKLAGTIHTAPYERIRVHRESAKAREVLEDMIPAIVDKTVAAFLQLIQAEEDYFKLQTETGEIVGLWELSDGAAGEYGDADSWRHYYSKERIGEDEEAYD